MIARAGVILSTPPPTARGSSEPMCDHCRLPVPAGLVEAGADRQFCCQGCRTAFDVIHGCGLERYYRLREESSAAERSPARTTARRFAEFDDAVFRSLYCRPLPGGRCQAELFLEGVHCAACVWLVERLPVVLPGVVEARLDVRRSLVSVTWDEGKVPLSRIARALASLGYPPHPARGNAARSAKTADDRRTLIRIAVAGACAGNVMLLALALYAGMFDTMEAQYSQLFRWTSMFLSLVSLAWPGSVFFRGAWAAIRTRALHLDLPIAVGLGAGGIWGVANTIRGTGEIYFDSLSVLVFVLLVGRWIQRRQQRWSADAVELLFSLTPASARIVETDERGVDLIRDVPVEAVKIGAVVEIRAGDSVPADGEVVAGASSVDQSLLTGESVPVEVCFGDHVAAGAVNLSGRLRVRVLATGEQTRVGRLMRIVEEGASRRAPIVRLADRIAGWFVAGMLTLAAMTALAWAFIDPSRAIDNAAALLIVTCPCALGLATPLAVTVATGRAARRGILVKGGDAVEKLARPGRIFLDKTGTLTLGRLSLVRWHGPDWVRPLVAAIESQSSHPIALALVRDLDGVPPLAEDIVQTTGGGIEGRVGGRIVAVGSPAYILARRPDPSGWDPRVQERIACDGLTPILIEVDGRVVAAAGLGDAIRPDVPAAVRKLSRAGWEVSILSGDHSAVVARVAEELGVPPSHARGGATPEDKLALITAASGRSRIPVVMVGDGVNDAAALAAADVGIAVHGGAEASLAAADIYIGKPGLCHVADLIAASSRTLRVIRRNLAASLVYNIAAAALAMTGVINPLIAAVLMPASSLTVLTLSLRCCTFDRPEGRPCP